MDSLVQDRRQDALSANRHASSSTQNDTTRADLLDLTGKVALVCGGYGAIGREISALLSAHGAFTVILGRNLAKANALAERIVARGCNASALALDMKDTASMQREIDALAARSGAIDIVVNCIGLQREQPVGEITEDALDDIYAANLKAAMFLGQAVARHQISGAKGGRHIHILSTRSLLGIRGRGYSAYCSVKGALVLMIRQYAVELAPHRITVNGVAPCAVATERLRADPTALARTENLIRRIPLGRIAEPADVASTVLFFASTAAQFITGQTLVVDGGLSSCE